MALLSPAGLICLGAHCVCAYVVIPRISFSFLPLSSLFPFPSPVALLPKEFPLSELSALGLKGFQTWPSLFSSKNGREVTRANRGFLWTALDGAADGG